MIVPSVVGGSSRACDNREVGLATYFGHAGASRNKSQRALGIERVLKRARLTMVELSARTRGRFGEKSPYFISRTFLYKQTSGVTPHICQVVALSEITGYRFDDWMKLCGFDLTLIPGMQLIIPNERTKMVTPWRGVDRVNGATEYRHQDRYCYAKVGSRDAVLYPVVRPGSIVRADRRYSQEIFKSGSSAEHLWLVEHPTGITCCRVKSVGRNEVILLPHLAPLSPWPLRLSTQVRILGLVDSHTLPYQEHRVEPSRGAREPRESALSTVSKDRMNVSQLLRASRVRTGLTFREAHRMSLQIARLLQNREFGISISLLSDYEAINKLPRHIAKIITLCVIYGIDVWELLRAAGVKVQDSNKSRLFKDRKFARGDEDYIPNWLNELGAVPEAGHAAGAATLQTAFEH